MTELTAKEFESKYFREWNKLSRRKKIETMNSITPNEFSTVRYSIRRQIFNNNFNEIYF